MFMIFLLDDQLIIFEMSFSWFRKNAQHSFYIYYSVAFVFWGLSNNALGVIGTLPLLSNSSPELRIMILLNGSREHYPSYPRDPSHG